MGFGYSVSPEAVASCRLVDVAVARRMFVPVELVTGIEDGFGGAAFHRGAAEGFFHRIARLAVKVTVAELGVGFEEVRRGIQALAAVAAAVGYEKFPAHA